MLCPYQGMLPLVDVCGENNTPFTSVYKSFSASLAKIVENREP